jgi:hypothetical protein
MRVTKKRIIDFLSPEVAVVLLILILFISGFTVYLVNRPASPSFHIYDESFKFGEESRIIEFYVEADRNSVELYQFFVNNEAVNIWESDKRIITAGEITKCVLNYRWEMGAIYTIKLVTTDDKSAELLTQAPEVTSNLQLELTNVDLSQDSGSLNVNAAYEAFSNGTDSLHVLLFTYQSFEKKTRPVYIFYDTQYLSDESLERADAIIDYFGTYNVDVEKLDYNEVGDLENRRDSILILLNPLKDQQGAEIENALPAPLIDADGNGSIIDDSAYNKTLLYDWMKDNNLVLITAGSLQPYKRIVYRDGNVFDSLDSTELFDAHLFLTDAVNEGSIINGSFVLGNYSAVRLSSTMGLSYSRSSFGFDKDAMERHALHYYGYGDYSLPYNEVSVNLTLPVFIRVGEGGGWLAMGDGESGLSKETLAHDLFMIYLQSIWDSEWVPYGWYWDSANAFDLFGGELTVSNKLDTSIPSKVVGDKLVVRIVAIAYSEDLESGMILDQVAEQDVP